MNLTWKPSNPVRSEARARTIRAANNNGGRRVVLQLRPLFDITNAEIEVFGSFLGEAEAANDNVLFGAAS